MRHSLLAVWLLAIASSSFAIDATLKTKAIKLYQRITGVPLLLNDPRVEQIAKLIEANDLMKATEIAVESPHFYQITLRDWAAVMSNKEETPLVPLDDFQAMVIGVTRDDRDARELLSGNFRYEAKSDYGFSAPSHKNNTHFAQLEKSGTFYKEALVRRTPQWDDVSEAAGLLTSRAWAKAHFLAGTNRRAVQYTFREFLCSPIEQWKDGYVPDMRVRRDVDRSPGGDPDTYQGKCRFCHSPMDALGGAFANFDWKYESIIYYGAFGVAPKMRQNGDVYPQGYVPSDTGWINLANQHHNESFGWRGKQEGIGVQEFGAMVANAKGFSQCMAKRAYKKVCRHEASAEIQEALAEQFEKDGYRLKRLFQHVAVRSDCAS